MEFVAQAYDSERPIRVRIRGSRIEVIRSATVPSGSDLVCVAPAFTDLLVGGAGGYAFDGLTLSIEQVAGASKALERRGITAFCPTLPALPTATLEDHVGTIAGACEQSPQIASRIAGIHLDGAFSGPEQGPGAAARGAAAGRPDWDIFGRLQDAAGGRIRLLTLSAGGERTADFIRRATDSGVRVAIGPTAARGDEIRAAVDAGATLSMHLGIAAHERLRRHPNHLWDQLAEDRLVAAVAAADERLSEPLLKILLRAKSPERCLLVGGSRGGSRLVQGLARMLGLADCRLAQVLDMAGAQPRRALGMPPVRLAAGSTADLVLLRSPPASPGALRVTATIQNGNLLHGALPPDPAA